jgi:hypothetical protein
VTTRKAIAFGAASAFCFVAGAVAALEGLYLWVDRALARARW